MAVPTKMSDLSVVAGDNSPVGSESPISTDDFHRSIQAILRTTNAKGSDIASATTTDIGAATAEFVDVTGTTTITGLGTIAAGIVRTVRFTGALTLTHNATSLILPTGRNILTAAGDIAQFRSLGSGNWVCVGYLRANGFPLNMRKGADVASATTLPLINDGNYFDVTGTTTITAFASLGVGSWIGLHFDGILTLTHNATDLVLPGGANITTAAGDEAIFVEYASGDWRCVSYTRSSGTALAESSKIQPITASVAANALTITLNPTTLDFRDATLGSGTVNTRTISSAISITVSSGSTLGTINAVQNRLAVLAIDNAGTVEVAVVNLAGGVNLDETSLISTTAEGGAGGADSATVIYSTTARTNVPYRVVGYLESTQATAGTWATAPSLIQGSGGQSLQHVGKIFNSLGVTATGTSIDFTGIPSWVKKITVSFFVVSSNGTSPFMIQVGSSSGVLTTADYRGAASNLSGSPSFLNNTTGFHLQQSVAAAAIYNGAAVLNLCDPVNHRWSCFSSLGRSDAAATNNSGGSVALLAQLDRIRVTTINGTDAYDAGLVSILAE